MHFFPSFVIFVKKHIPFCCEQPLASKQKAVASLLRRPWKPISALPGLDGFVGKVGISLVEGQRGGRGPGTGVGSGWGGAEKGGPCLKEGEGATGYAVKKVVCVGERAKD